MACFRLLHDDDDDDDDAYFRLFTHKCQARFDEMQIFHLLPFLTNRLSGLYGVCVHIGLMWCIEQEAPLPRRAQRVRRA